MSVDRTKRLSERDTRLIQRDTRLMLRERALTLSSILLAHFHLSDDPASTHCDTIDAR